MSRISIQNDLREMYSSMYFDTVVYDDGNVASISPDKVKAHKVYVNELAKTYETDSSNGRDRVQKVAKWVFACTLSFLKEVDIVSNEQQLIMLPNKRIDNIVYCARVSGIVFDHPVQKYPNTGSSVKLTIEIAPLSGK